MSQRQQPESLYELGIRFQLGDRVLEDPCEAYKLYKLALETAGGFKARLIALNLEYLAKKMTDEEIALGEQRYRHSSKCG